MEDKLMHDWTLTSVEMDWPSGTVRLGLVSTLGDSKHLTVHDWVEFSVPRQQEWGPSNSIMSSDGPRPRPDGHLQLRILMQSGDTLSIAARRIDMPSAD